VEPLNVNFGGAVYVKDNQLQVGQAVSSLGG